MIHGSGPATTHGEGREGTRAGDGAGDLVVAKLTDGRWVRFDEAVFGDVREAWALPAVRGGVLDNDGRRKSGSYLTFGHVVDVELDPALAFRPDQSRGYARADAIQGRAGGRLVSFDLNRRASEHRSAQAAGAPARRIPAAAPATREDDSESSTEAAAKSLEEWAL